MIPIIMIREIPFPIPLSVIFSPSHIMNMVPAVRMIMAAMREKVFCKRLCRKLVTQAGNITEPLRDQDGHGQVTVI
jgi:hypothetical protein